MADTFYVLETTPGSRIYRLGPNQTLPPNARVVNATLGPRTSQQEALTPTPVNVERQQTPGISFRPRPTVQQPLNLQPATSTRTAADGSIDLRAPNQQAAAASAEYTLPSQQPGNFVSSAVVAPPESIGPKSFVGQIPFFLNAVLSTPAGALPKAPLWIVVFQFDNNIKNTIKRVKEYEPRMPEPWEVDSALETVTSRRYQEEKGCMFVQTVTLPGEQLFYTQEGIQYNSFIRGGVATGRRDFDTVRISFLNTNVNFVDNVIRPWLIMTGHLGMVARPPEQKYRCNMTVYRLGIDKVDRPPFIAQQFNFWEVCPINISNESLDYTDNGSVSTKEAEFAYQWYTTTSNKNTFAVPGIEASPVGGPDVRRAIPV